MFGTKTFPRGLCSGEHMVTLSGVSTLLTWEDLSAITIKLALQCCASAKETEPGCGWSSPSQSGSQFS